MKLLLSISLIPLLVGTVAGLQASGNGAPLDVAVLVGLGSAAVISIPLVLIILVMSIPVQSAERPIERSPASRMPPIQQRERIHPAEVQLLRDQRLRDQRRLDTERSELIHTDRYGALYRLRTSQLDGDEPVLFVVVRNSTPEPDGRHETHKIRVRPDVKTAHEAVASTFGLTPDQYNPIFES